MTGVPDGRPGAAPAPRPWRRRRRIVILTEDSKPALGGIAEYLHQLALVTSATHDVLIVTSVPGAVSLNPGLPFRYREVEWYRPLRRWIGDGFMPVRRINTVAWQLMRRHRVRAMLATIHAEDPDSSYVVGRLSAVTLPWAVACSDLGLPYAVIGHGLELVEPLSRQGRRRRAARVVEAEHWFANSRDTADKLAQYGVAPERRSLLLPGVADTSNAGASEATRRAVRESLGLGTRRFLLSLCYLRRRKGIDIGIQAFARVAQDYPDLRYVVAGAGPEQESLMALARAHGVRDQVVFAGAIDDLTKAALFAECEFFVLPTRAVPDDVEGFGIVFLEAGLYGKAVIGGAHGGVPEAVADGMTGLLVDTEDESGLRDAELRLLRDPAYAAALGRQGRERARSEFSWRDRGRIFADRLDELATPAAAPATRRARPTTPVVRVRRGMGTASNRLNSSVDTMTGLIRRGRLFTFLSHRPAPADREACAQAIVAWIRRAISAAGGEGASASYHIAHGWAAAYPEITGYLISTLLHYAAAWNDRTLADAAHRAGSWLADTRLPGGAICRKQWHPDNRSPSVFNTAQVMEGWCALARAERAHPAPNPTPPDWEALARESGDWLLSEQEPSGCWTRNAFNQIPHTYYARVAGPLARLADLSGDDRYAHAAVRALDWVLSQQTASGWFRSAGFTPSELPTTHTIGYVLEGLVNGGTLLGEPRYVEAADRAAQALLRVHQRRGSLPGRFAADWRPRARWRCLTGNAQVAIVWCLLARHTGNHAYRAAAEDMADELRRSVRITPSWPEISGGVQGSSPAWGEYDPFGYPTHAAKFTLDLFALLAA